MANFNAGAIEATLTLDRSAFARDLKEAQAQAKAFEKNKITIPLEIDGLEAFTQLREQIANADGKTIGLDVDLHGDEVIALLEAQLDAIKDQTVTIELAIDGLPKIGELEAMLTAIPDETVTVDVDTDGAVSGLKKLAGQRDSIRGTTVLVGALIAILPAIVPLALAAAAAVGALVSATGILAVGIGAFALAALPAWKAYTKAVKAAKGDLSQLPPQMRALHTEQERFNNALKGTADVNRIYALIGGVFRLLTTVIQQLRPVIVVVTMALSQLVTKLILFAESPAFKQMVSFIVANFIPVFMLVTSIFGNLIKTIGGIVVAFAPFAKEFLGGLNQITAAWAKWAGSLSSSKKFQDFLSYVRETGPKIIALFMSISAAIGNIGKALAPLGGGTLDVLIGFFNFIANMNTSVLGAIVVGIGALTVGIIAATVAMAAFDAVAALNPFVLLALLIVALVGAFIYLWKTNEGFRNFFIKTWDAIWGFMKAVGAWFAGPFAGFFVAAWNGLMAGLRAIGAFFTAVWNGIVSAVKTAVGFVAMIITTYINIWKTIIGGFVTAVTAVWKAFWDLFGGVLTAAFNFIKQVFLLQFKAIGFVVNTALNAINAVVKAVWNGIKSFISANLEAIKKIVNFAWSAIKAGASTAWTAIKNVISNIWKSVSGPIESVLTTIKSKLSGAWTAVKSTASSAWEALKKIIGDKIDGAKNKVESVIKAIKGAFSGANKWLYDAGVNIIRGLLDGIESMINSVTSKLKKLTDLIPKSKGPESRDKRLLTPNGEMIMQSLANGITAGTPAFLGQLKDLTNSIPEMVGKANVQLTTSGSGGTATATQATPLTKEQFMASMIELIKEIRANTQPLIGEYNDASKDPREVAEEFWFITKGRGI